MIKELLTAALLASFAVPASALQNAAVTDPPVDAAHPPAVDAFVLPVGNGAMNMVIYTAAGAAPHPTLLLLHGFPGNEQGVDLAQAARRAGWNVLTMHYRGSWGSPGAFSFSGAAEDAHAALAFLRRPATLAKYRIDPRRIAVAGHSMGGFMAADAAADDPRVIGLFLVDAWDIGADGRTIRTPAGAKAWHEEAVGDLPPLAGTSEQALADEMARNPDRLDLQRRIAAFGNRPLDIIGAQRGNGAGNLAYLRAARRAGNRHVSEAIWPSDHSFSDKRIALSKRLVAWLGMLRPLGR